MGRRISSNSNYFPDKFLDRSAWATIFRMNHWNPNWIENEKFTQISQECELICGLLYSRTPRSNRFGRKQKTFQNIFTSVAFKRPSSPPFSSLVPLLSLLWTFHPSNISSICCLKLNANAEQWHTIPWYTLKFFSRLRMNGKNATRREKRIVLFCEE